MEPRAETRSDLLATFFESLFTNFADSAALRRSDATERLTVLGHPAAQARFTDDALNSVVRVVRFEDRAVLLAVLKEGSVEENEPAVGVFLNSLQAVPPVP
jgi:hypothetical protein